RHRLRRLATCGGHVRPADHRDGGRRAARPRAGARSDSGAPARGSRRPMQIGFFLSCEEYTPAQLLDQARRAEQAGFDALWISDHYHPWTDAQGQSAFVWSVIGALSQVTTLPVTTGVRSEEHTSELQSRENLV